MCQQLTLADEDQVSGRGIHGRCIRVEQALRLESVELADIDATGIRPAGHEKEKVATIGEELRERMTALLRRLDPCYGSGFSTRSGNAENRSAGPLAKEDRAVAVPRAPEGVWNI